MKGSGNDTWEGFTFRRVSGVLNALFGDTHVSFESTLDVQVKTDWLDITAFVFGGFVPRKWQSIAINESPTV